MNDALIKTSRRQAAASVPAGSHRQPGLRRSLGSMLPARACAHRPLPLPAELHDQVSTRKAMADFIYHRRRQTTALVREEFLGKALMVFAIGCVSIFVFSYVANMPGWVMKISGLLSSLNPLVQ